MTTEKQTEANRKNAKQSTGPKSSQGKAVVKKNAITHGLTSKETLLPTEDPNEWNRFQKRLFSEIQPTNEMETLLAERIASSAWRLRRVLQVESGIFSFQYFRLLEKQAEEEADTYTRIEGGMQAIFASSEGETVIFDDAAYEDAKKRSHEASLETKSHVATMGNAFLWGADGLMKLSRYEATIERSLQRSLRELERMRAAS